MDEKQSDIQVLIAYFTALVKIRSLIQPFLEQQRATFIEIAIKWVVTGHTLLFYWVCSSNLLKQLQCGFNFVLQNTIHFHRASK